MNKTKISTALAALATLAISGAAAQSGPAAEPGFKFEKCFGVVKSGQNDCQTSTHSCAGTVTKDNQGDAWLYVPAGTCAKIVGGSTEMKS